MRVIGVVGGIGSGKSALCEAAEKELSARLFKTDLIAKELMRPETACYAELCAVLGTEILKKDGSGELDPIRYAKRLYSDPQFRKKSDGIVHPAVWAEIKARLSEAKAETEENAAFSERKLCLIETALPDADFLPLCESVVYVHTEKEIRIKRLMESRGYSREKCLSVIGGQPSEEAYRSLSDLEVDNSGTQSFGKEAFFKAIKKIIKGA